MTNDPKKNVSFGVPATFSEWLNNGPGIAAAEGWGVEIVATSPAGSVLRMSRAVADTITISMTEYDALCLSAEVPASDGEAERIAQLEKALEPFARFFKSENHDMSPANDATIFAAFRGQDGEILADLSLEDIRRAWTVLNKKEK